jgi:hypothetical protein
MNTLFPETLTRLQYLTRVLIWCVTYGVVFALLFPLVKVKGTPYHDLFTWVFTVPMLIMRFPCLEIPRCRDIGWSPWRLLLLLVPLANLFIVLSLFVWPTQRD